MMSIYILDTDIISYLWDDKSPYHARVVERLSSLSDSDVVGISVISIYELTYGMDSFKDEELQAIFKNALVPLKQTNPKKLLSQRLSPISPFKRFCQGFIKIINKAKYLILQILFRSKTTPLNHLLHKNSKPNLNLI